MVSLIGITHGLRVIFRTAYNTFKLMKIVELDFVLLNVGYGKVAPF